MFLNSLPSTDDVVLEWIRLRKKRKRDSNFGFEVLRYPRHPKLQRERSGENTVKIE